MKKQYAIIILMIAIIILSSCKSEMQVVLMRTQHNEKGEANLLKAKDFFLKGERNQQIVQIPIFSGNSINTLLFWNGEFKMPNNNELIHLISIDSLILPQNISINKIEPISNSYEKIVIDMKDSVSPYEEDWLNELIRLTEKLPKGEHRIQFISERYLVPGSLSFVYYIYTYLDEISIRKNIKISCTYDNENDIYYTSIWLTKK